MNPKQMFGMAGGFLFVYIVITLTNKPQVAPKGEPGTPEQPAVVAEQGAPGAPPAQPAVGRTDLRDALGFCLPGLGAETLASAETDSLIARMADGGRWVTISPALFQENGFASAVSADPAQSPSEASLAHAIAEAHNRGLKVVLRPVVVAKDATRRERLVPGDPDAWFESYAQALAPYVALAEREHVEVLSIGANYAQLERSARWPALIKDVRTRYRGQLTYGAGLQSESGNGGYQAVPFWGELDYVGLEAPLPGDVPLSANDHELDTAWESIGEGVGTWLSQQSSGRRVMFTSVGFAPNATPIEAGAAYRAFKRAMGHHAWLAAASWYQWSDGLDRAPSDTQGGSGGDGAGSGGEAS